MNKIVETMVSGAWKFASLTKLHKAKTFTLGSAVAKDPRLQSISSLRSVLYIVLIAASKQSLSLPMDYWSGGDLLFSEDGQEIESFPLNFDGDDISKDTQAIQSFPLNFDRDDISIDTQAIESLDFMDLGLSEMMRKLLPYRPSTETCGIINSDNGNVFSPGCITTPNSLLGDEESGAGVSSSVMELNAQSSPLMSLNPGMLTECGDADYNSSNKGSVLSSLSSPHSNKRARVANFYSQTPFCQVYGCGVDLSSLKEYYKKHRVCILHTKTARVIVDGIEQRFCQQCSRFHLLAEFDDGKRSCRKRLAGHNKRRRKPQFDSAIDEQKFLQSYQDIIPGGVLCPDTHKMINLSKTAELKAGSKYSPQFAMAISKRQLLPTSTHFHNRNRVGKPSRITSKGEEEFSLLNAALTVRKLSEASRASCALSLLSAHSQSSQNHSAGIQLDGSATFQNNSVIKNVEKLLGVRPLEEESFPPARFLSSRVNFLKDDQISPVSGLEVGVRQEELSRRFNYLECKSLISPEQGPTVDLFQLSSNLQMVEYQRNMFNQSDFLIAMKEYRYVMLSKF